MSWWKYKPIFEIKWREPYGFTRSLSKLTEKNTRWWIRPFWGVINTVILIGLWTIAKPAPGAWRVPLAYALPLCIAAGFGLVYFSSFVHYFAPREIGFGPKAIVSILGQNSTPWPYERIREVRFENKTFGQKQFQVMIVTMTGGRQLAAAVPDKINIQEVVYFLKDKGVEAIFS